MLKRQEASVWRRATLCFLLLCTMFTGSGVCESSMVTASNFAGSPIGLHAPGDTTFAELFQAVAKADTKNAPPASTSGALMACGVTATNLSSLRVHALSVLFDYDNKKGFHKHESVLLYNLDDNPRSAILLPTETRLLALPSKVTYLYSSLGRSAGIVIGNSSSVETWCDDLTKLSVTIDAVVLSDGSILGPDTEHTAEKLNAQIDAITDVCAYIVRHAEDASLTKMTSTLRSYAAEKALQDDISTGRKHYLEVRRSYARLLLGTDGSNPGEIVQTAKKILATSHIPRIHRS